MFKILITRQLSGRQVEYARLLNLDPVIKPALEFKFPEYWDEVLKVITEHDRASWVFTSSNGVKALEALIGKGFQVNPQRTIYAVGSKTQEALQKLGLESVIPRIQDGAHLADKIIAEQEKEVLYFHGNLSRDEMTNMLTGNDISVTGLEVYETIIHPVEMPAAPVEGILFYSPSAVEGFKRGAGFNRELPRLFAIGQTTAAALREETDQSVVVARQPDTKIMLQTVSDNLYQAK